MMMKKLWPVIGLVVVIGFVAAALLWPDHRAKISFKLPAQLSQGQIIEVPLKISADQTINAAEFYFDFPANLLSVKEIKKDGSFYQLWVKDSPGFDNPKGTIYLAGGLPSPGFTGQNGLVATVVFTVKSAGSGHITLESKSRVLLNDGLGTAMPLNWQPVNFTISP